MEDLSQVGAVVSCREGFRNVHNTQQIISTLYLVLVDNHYGGSCLLQALDMRLWLLFQLAKMFTHSADRGIRVQEYKTCRSLCL